MIRLEHSGPPLDAALIDLDGTLLDTAADLAAAINRMLAALGRAPRDDALITRYIGKGIPVGALVYGRHAVEADIWLQDGTRAVLGEYRIIGQSIARRYSAPRPAEPNSESYDRQVRMFGAAGQAILARARIAIVGLGGVGSLVAEYAAHLGIGEFVLVDPDRIESTNLSRVVGASGADVAASRLKTEIAARLIRSSNPQAKIDEYPFDVLDAATAAQLRDCDYVFLCADSMRARLLVNAVAHQYFVPMVQLGAKITAADDGSLTDAMSAVRTVRPGEGCLWCNGFIPSGTLALEAKSDEERKAQAYGTGEPDPSVITMNAVAAAQGINDFLFDYLELRDKNEEWRFEHSHFLSRRTTRAVPRREPECPECVGRYGLGDAKALPGIVLQHQKPQCESEPIHAERAKCIGANRPARGARISDVIFIQSTVYRLWTASASSSEASTASVGCHSAKSAIQPSAPRT